MSSSGSGGSPRARLAEFSASLNVQIFVCCYFQGFQVNVYSKYKFKILFFVDKFV